MGHRTPFTLAECNTRNAYIRIGWYGEGVLRLAKRFAVFTLRFSSEVLKFLTSVLSCHAVMTDSTTVRPPNGDILSVAVQCCRCNGTGSCQNCLHRKHTAQPSRFSLDYSGKSRLIPGSREFTKYPGKRSLLRRDQKNSRFPGNHCRELVGRANFFFFSLKI